MSAKFMVGILNGRYWMIKGDQVNVIKVCAFPPSKQVLNKLLVEALTKHPPVSDLVDR